MSSEIFRFVTVRPPQKIAPERTPAGIDLNVPESKLADQLRKQRTAGARKGMTDVAAKFIASPDFIDSSGKLDPKLAAFFAALASLPDAGFWTAARAALGQTVGVEAKAFVDGDVFGKAYAQVADSVVAAAVDNTIAVRVRTRLSDAIRGLWLIRRMAEETPVTRAAFVNAALVMPAGIFPLPVADPSLKDQREAKAKANQAALDTRRKHMADLAKDLADQRAAADELLGTFELTGAAPAANPVTARVAAGVTSVGPTGFMLPDSAAGTLSATTKSALGKVGLATSGIDVAKSVTVLEKRSTQLATQLYANTGDTGFLVRIGQNFFPQNALLGGLNVIDVGPMITRSPGPCAPVVDTAIPDDGVTVPTGQGDARVLGIADLMVLEQNLARYQLGDISHIENVLRSEVRSRKFTTKDSTQVTQLTETETTEDKEQDLSTDERFQLQTESQTVITQTASKDAGLTIHASYGPSVDATANYNASSSTSSQQSNQASSDYAREITSKAVQRVQTRNLTSRTVVTLHEAVEVNHHAFDNKQGAEDIVGVYRFIDKVYSAQIINYGKRLMLEFIVPEPAAFMRYAMTHKPMEAVTLIDPDPPGYCLGDAVTFQRLQASDITRDNYLYWASKYGAQDVTTPPPSVIIAQGAKKAPDQMPAVGDRLLASDTFDVAIADGYLTQSAYVNIYGETQAGKHQLVFQLQEQQGFYIEPADDNHLYYLHLQPTPALTITINSVGFHNWEVLVTVFCTLSMEKFQDWQLKTFASIMNAYNDLKSAYDQAVREARLQAADTSGVSGTNPLTNLITQQTELKKGCISLMTGQRFDLFDAVNRNVAPYGYPEIDFTEAKAEGAYIATFEQSFEWNNMVYLFYPYFWGKKDDWPTLAQLSDPDPVFQQFLQAGAARVQVPVRPGFEAGVLTYLSTGVLWSADGTLVNSDDNEGDPQVFSIIDELRSQTGNNNVDGVGTVSVTQNSAQVVGDGTVFTDHDVNRRLIVGGFTCIIKSVAGPETITLTAPYAGETAQNVGYATGGKLVGQPWEVKVPTQLVKLDNTLVFS
jgi:hypothetical protein